MTRPFIRHTVVFILKHPLGSEASRAFLADAERILTAIPGVQHFETLRQISGKNRFHYGLSMEFATLAAYQAYNVHPEHVRFVTQRWIPEVEDFMEIDYTPHDCA